MMDTRARTVLWVTALVLGAACSSPPATDSSGLDAGDAIAADVTPTTDAAVDATDAATLCPGGGGCACTADTQCASKHCLTDETGAQACARACTSDLCPAGFGCGVLDGRALCLPRRVNVCEPCLKDSNECEINGLPGAACVRYGNMGAFCGAPCLGNADCGSGFACRSVERIEGGQTQQCVHVDNAGALAECACSQRAIDAKKSTICGVTGGGAHTCLGLRACSAGGLSLCDAPTPSSETCDGIDNDCNGATDEGTCSDTNPCTNDVCSGAAGCTFPPNTKPCSDGNLCTTNDACAGGICTGTTGTCDDGNPCTDDPACDTAKGCLHSANVLACDDGDGCTMNDACKGGVCLPGAATVCNDGNGCTVDACVGGVCIYTPATGGVCNDNNACTLADACSEGSCAGSALNCDDANPCSVDSCAPAQGCVHADASGACDDGNACTEGDTCGNGGCFGTVKACPSPGPCIVAFCSAVAGGCGYAQKSDGTACNDGNACTSADACTNGACMGSATNCSDGNACTEDSCSLSTGCGHVALTGACDDGNACTQGDDCSTGTCVGAAVNCDDGKPCTDDSCAASGCKHVNRTGACDDGKVCTSGDICTGGICAGMTATDCSDGDPCTDDSCDPALGCKHAPNSTGTCNLDANLCTADACSAGTCVAGAAKICNDGLSCTTDACDAASGTCTFAPVSNGTACDDGNKCTSPDTCQAGACVGSQPANSVTTYAGQGAAGGSDDANNQVASFSGPRSVAIDASGNLYVADTGNAKIRKIAAGGGVTTFAGQGTAGYQEGVGTLAQFRAVQAVVVAGNNLFVSDSDMQNIRKVASDQTTSLVAGIGINPDFPATKNTGGFQDGPAATALFSTPMGLAWNATSGVLYVADQGNNRIRAIDITNATVSTLAGTGTAGQVDGALASATFNQPTGLWLSADATKLYVTDIGSNTVRLIDLGASLVSTIAGVGTSGSANGANLTVASFNAPVSITGDGTTLWLADRGNQRIRAISATTTSTLTGSVGSPFINGTFSGSTFNQPSGILWVSAGVWYVADTKNNRIRKLLDPNAGCVP